MSTHKNDHFFPRPERRRPKNKGSADGVEEYLDWITWRRLEAYRVVEDMRPETWRRRG